MRTIGSRVGALASADEVKAYVYGFGMYVGDEIPETAGGWMGEALRESKVQNPKIVLDDGSVVWGCECWWGPEEDVRRRIGDREIVLVDIREARVEAARKGGLRCRVN